MPHIVLPVHPMILSDLPRTFHDVSKIIFYMRASSSPCPLDGISVIVLKRCPILRTHLAKLLSACWMQSHFPASGEDLRFRSFIKKKILQIRRISGRSHCSQYGERYSIPAIGIGGGLPYAKPMHYMKMQQAPQSSSSTAIHLSAFKQMLFFELMSFHYCMSMVF